MGARRIRQARELMLHSNMFAFESQSSSCGVAKIHLLQLCCSGMKKKGARFVKMLLFDQSYMLTATLLLCICCSTCWGGCEPTAFASGALWNPNTHDDRKVFKASLRFNHLSEGPLTSAMAAKGWAEKCNKGTNEVLNAQVFMYLRPSGFQGFPTRARTVCWPSILRLRGGGMLKKLMKGLPMNHDEKKFFAMSKNKELHRFLNTDHSKSSRQDLAIIRKKERRSALRLPPAAHESVALRIAEKAKQNPLLAAKSSALARITSQVKKQSGGRPDVWLAGGEGLGSRVEDPGNSAAKSLVEGTEGLMKVDKHSAAPKRIGKGMGNERVRFVEGDECEESKGKGREGGVGWRFQEALQAKKRGEMEFLKKQRAGREMADEEHM